MRKCGVHLGQHHRNHRTRQPKGRLMKQQRVWTLSRALQHLTVDVMSNLSQMGYGKESVLLGSNIVDSGFCPSNSCLSGFVRVFFTFARVEGW